MTAKYGFVVHPITALHLVVQRLWRLGRGAGPLLRYPRLVTTRGASVDGLIYGVPQLPKTMLENEAEAVSAVVRGVNALAQLGAGAVGLGALCAVIGSRGRAVAEAVDVPVTTGHHLTAWAAAATLELVARRASIPVDEPVVVAGAPYSVAVAAAELLARGGRPVHVAVRGKGGAVRKVAARTPGIQLVDPAQAIKAARLLVLASSTGGVVAEADLAPGAIVVDVARPRDVTARRGRSDVLIVDGELVSLPPGTDLGIIPRAYNTVVGQSYRHVFACFAAPMLMAVTGVPQPVGPERFCDPTHVAALGELAEHHGFFVDGLFDRGRAVNAEVVDRFCVVRSALEAGDSGPRRQRPVG